MTFEEILDQAIVMLRHRGRLTYRALKRQFDLDDDYLEDLKAELIQGQRLAIDEVGEVLVWTGGTDVPPLTTSPARQPGAQPGTSDAQLTQILPPPAAPQSSDAERRQLTVMFCDLVDSTALSAQLDPEDLRDVVRAYQAACAEVIRRFDGHIAQYLGDGLLVYFGYPQAHEDDAQRAVHTGIEILEAMRRLNTQMERERRVRLAVRLGIHTGLVVVGEMGGSGRQEQLAVGETMNVASRLQGLTVPDTVVISAATHQLVRGLFTCHALEAPTLKGFTEPLAVYHVHGVSVAQSRFEVAVTMGLTPLVGREEEVTLLQRRWAQARDGHGQVVLLSGEVGIGKSRVVQVLKDQVAQEPHTRLECRCSPYYQQSALYPMIALWQRLARFQPDDTPAEKLRKLDTVLASRAPRPTPLPPDTVPLLAALLSVPMDDRYPLLTLTPQRQRQRTLETLLAFLLELAAPQPLLCVVEDLHWVDPSTLEFLSLLIEQVATAPLYLLLTYRPTFRPPWAIAAHMTLLTLNRFAPQQVERMATHVAGGKALPAVVRQQVVTQTDGIPLFIEELTKTILESGLLREQAERYELAGPLPPLAIPTTLHDALLARLDRLATGKAVAQLGATIGRQFTYEMLYAVAQMDEGTLQAALVHLSEAELLFQRGVPPHATYLFKHALIQEAAYQSLLRSTRQRHHQRIAQVLEEQFPETANAQPELLAHHYTEAGMMAQAIPYWQRAGQRAVERSAYLEAISHITKGLELLKLLPVTVERAQQELALQAALGAVLIATKGQAAPEVECAYARARELCRQVGETPQLFPVLFGLWGFYEAQGEFQTARELGEQLLTLAQRVQDSALLLEAHHALGATLFWLGEVVPARAHFEQGIALYDPQQHRSVAFLYGEDPGVVCRSYAARTLWFLGYPDQALKQSREALALARELAHPFSLAYALTCAAALHQFCREVPATQAQAEEAMTLSTEQGLPYWVAWGTVLRGWALAEQGQGAEGVAQMRQGLAAYRATGAELLRPYFLAMLAEAYGNIGQTEEGPSVMAEALAMVHKNRVRFYEAELYRLKGELLLTLSPEHHAEAETCFWQALDVARHQQATSLELRVAMSLSRLWQQQGKRQEACSLLAPIYGWFTEGFDTADLQEAKALLEALA